MNEFFLVASVLNWILVGVGFWLGWQLLRQNGRILLRLDETEKRLDELEFGEPSEPKSLSDNEAAGQMNARPHPGPLSQERENHRSA